MNLTENDTAQQLRDAVARLRACADSNAVYPVGGHAVNDINLVLDALIASREQSHQRRETGVKLAQKWHAEAADLKRQLDARGQDVESLWENSIALRKELDASRKAEETARRLADQRDTDSTVLGDQCDVYLARAEKAEAELAELRRKVAKVFHWTPDNVGYRIVDEGDCDHSPMDCEEAGGACLFQEFAATNEPPKAEKGVQQVNNIRTCQRCGTSWTADELLSCPECKAPIDDKIRRINEFCAKWRGPNTLTLAYNEALLAFLARDRAIRAQALAAPNEPPRVAKDNELPDEEPL